jgi:hypothetical protein
MPVTESGRELLQKAAMAANKVISIHGGFPPADEPDDEDLAVSRAILDVFADHVNARHESEVKACDAGDDDEEYQMYMEGRVDALGELLSDLRP